MASQDPPEHPVTGLVAGKYELVKLIGRGGMGSVWEARHSTLGTRAAIKFIEPAYANSTEARSRFDTEARAAATLQSKYAIQIFDHGVTENGRPYIVMELLEGEPLDKRLERLGKISIQDIARILQHVSRALQKAHDAGIIHRDLKPENIFLVRTNEDEDEVAKVLDFGIAKIRGDSAGGLTSSTKTGAVLGTPYYMSPEQARGLRSVDHRTDIWSLAVIAYRCVTGVLPFEGESVGDLLVKICVSPIPVPSHVAPHLPPAFDQWFARSLDREPQNRFPAAREQADALAFAAGITVRNPALSGPRGSQPSHPSPLLTPNGHPMYGPPSAIPPTTPSPSGGSGSYPHQRPSNPAATAAPFVTSARPATRSSIKGIVALAVGAGVIGLGVGSFAFIRLTEKKAPPAISVGANAGSSSTAPLLTIDPPKPLAPLERPTLIEPPVEPSTQPIEKPKPGTTPPSKPPIKPPVEKPKPERPLPPVPPTPPPVPTPPVHPTPPATGPGY